MKISIITPSYNQANFLPRTRDSILSQTGDFELEWIVVDGGSTDGTLDILRATDDARLTWTSGRDAGQSDAINKGMAKASGDVVAWLNSDDLYAPGALAAVAAAFERTPSKNWLAGRCVIIDEHDQEIRHGVTRYKDRALRRYRYGALLRENFVSQPATFWRRSLWERVGPLDTSLHYTMDYDLWLRMGRVGDPLLMPEQVLAKFRLYRGSKSGATRREQFDEQYRVMKRYSQGRPVARLMHRINVEKVVWAYRLMRFMGI